MQELYLKFQMVHEQINEIEKQDQMFNSQIVELTSTIQSLDDFKKLKEGTEILVPLNRGMYAKAELKDNTGLLVNVGANVTVEKDIESTKKLINEQIAEITNVQQQMIASMQQLTSQAALIEGEINRISSEK